MAITPPPPSCFLGLSDGHAVECISDGQGEKVCAKLNHNNFARVYIYIYIIYMYIFLSDIVLLYFLNL